MALDIKQGKVNKSIKCPVKERPILCNGFSVRGILEDRKTQTRRVIKPQPYFEETVYVRGWVWEGLHHQDEADLKQLILLHDNRPYGQVGGWLWVRETLEHSSQGTPTRYAADGCPVMRDGTSIDWPFRTSPLPSIFMPRWASRITLEITGIRVERVQEITEGDAKAEGVTPPQFIASDRYWPTHKDKFRELWDSINGKKYPWESNPWVRLIEFRRLVNVN